MDNGTWNETEGCDEIFDDIWIYLDRCRGTQQLPLSMAIPLTVANVVIFVTGLLGNVAVCVVIIKHRSLHTATNYYLFNLAISDLTLLVFGLPNDIALYWHQYPWTLGESFCKLRALLSEMASYVSVLTIVAFSTERYLAICYPLYLHSMSGLQRAIRIIACLWILAFFSAMPFSYFTEVSYLPYPQNTTIPLYESAYCGMMAQPESIPLAEISTVVFFVIPLLAIAVQYTRMALEISKTTQRTLAKGLKGSVHRDSRRAQSNRSVIRMLSAVVIAFFVCWAPFHAQRLLVIYGRSSKNYKTINTWMFVITGLLYYLSSTLNPILYNVMSGKMRHAFVEVLCKFSKNKRRRTANRNSGFRDTTCSRSYNLRAQRSLLDDTEDRVSFMHKEIISVSMPDEGTKLVYEIHCKDERCNDETPI